MSATVSNTEEVKRELMSRFKTPVQITEKEGSEPPQFLVENILPENALVTFQGAAKSGKSTLLFHMIKAMLSGEDFMGLKTQKINIVYFSEQSRSTLLDQLRKAGLDTIPDNLHFCTSEDNWNLSWERAFTLGGQMVREVGAKLLVYDSWGRFARFSSDENEMAPSATQERVTVLRGIQSEFKVCILLNQHTSKGSKGAGIVAAGLGSSALAQQVDLLLSLSGEPKVPDIGEDSLVNPNCRALQGLGRFAPIKMAMELKDGKYIVSTFVQGRKKGGDPESVEQALLMLEMMFEGGKSRRSSQCIFDEAKNRGIPKNAVYLAAPKMGIRKKKIADEWVWQLTSQEVDKEAA
jgi:hypothetical protein